MSKRNETGAVTEDDFEEAFQLTPEPNIETLKELKEQLSKINIKLGSDDWLQRVDNLKLLRSLMKCSVVSKEEIIANIKFLDDKMKGCVSDLRSQVVREACITVAFMTHEFRTKLEYFLESLIESLINLVPNGTKIMATSGKVTLKYIVNNSQSQKLLPYFISSLSNSKSTLVRQFSSELMKIICEKWSVKSLDKNSANIAEAIRKGIYDADESARASSREAFCWFNYKFPTLANNLLINLDNSKQKALQRELNSFNLQNIGNTLKTDSDDKIFKKPTNTSKFQTSHTVRNTNSVTDSGTPRSRFNSAKSETNSVKPTKVATPKIATLDSRSRKPTKVSQSQLSTNDENNESIIVQHNAIQMSGDWELARNIIKPGLRFVNSFDNIVHTSTRETSPSSKTGYITYTNGSTESRNTNNFQKRGTPNQYSSLRYKNNLENIADKLNRHKQTSHEHYQSDDNMSETSSVVSDKLISFNEILPLLNSRNWGDRKRGLIKTEKFLVEGHLRPADRKALLDVFNAMFLENQSAVIKQFLSVLTIFIDSCHDQIQDWLYTLLIKLLNLHANDKLKSSKLTVQRILQLLIDKCGAKAVFGSCCKFIQDKNHDPTNKVKLSLLEYMKIVLTIAPPNILDTDFSHTLANIVIWTTEAKSTELRKMASNIVIKLFDLNSAQFTKILQELPSTFQDRATNILKLYLSTVKKDELIISDSVTDSNTSSKTSKLDPDKSAEYIRDNTEALKHLSLNCDNIDKYSSLSGSSSTRSGHISTTTPPAAVASNKGTYHRTSSTTSNSGGANTTKLTYNPNLRTNHSATPSNHQQLVYDNNSHIHKYIASQQLQQQHSAPVANIMSNNNYNNNVVIPPPSSVASLSNTNMTSNTGGIGTNNKLYPTSSNDSNIDTNNRYNPDYYSSGPIERRDIPQQSSNQLAPEDVMSEILKELSNHNDRQEERKACLFKLTKMFREKTSTDWDEYFKTLLFLLLETMADNDPDIRTQALLVLQELARSEPRRLIEFSQLTVLKVLEAHRDNDRSVAKAAEECCRVLTLVLPKETGLLRILIGAISDYNNEGEEPLDDDDDDETENRENNHLSVVPQGQNPLCLAALKTLLKFIKNTPDRQTIQPDLHSLCQALSEIINHSESNVRKETILCLVELYRLIGNEIRGLVKLTSSQSRLLEVYIKKNHAI